jgi:uncharacterized repeat protein (TIGR01451 family)
MLFAFGLSLALCSALQAGLLYQNIMVNDVQRGNAIADSDTSRNVVVDQSGNIHVAFYGTNGIRVASSTNRGASFNSSILISNVNAECELAIDQYNRLYLAWVEDGDIMFTTSSNGTTFTAPRAIGSCNSKVHMAVDAPYVYILPREGGPLYRNTSNGSGSFSSVSVDSGRTFADVIVNRQDHTVYVEADDPTVRYFVSTDYGASFGPAQTPGISVYYPSVAGMFTAAGDFMFIAGTSNTGYRINLASNTAATLTIDCAIEHGRSLAADNTGNLINGYLCSTGLYYSISTNYGSSFTTPSNVAGTVSSASFGINPLYGDVVAVYQDNGQIFCSIYDGELVCTNIDVRLDMTASPTTLRPDDLVVYSISITNMSSSTANELVASNYFPSTISYVGGSAAFSNLGGGVASAWIGTIGPYGGTNLVLTGRVASAASGMLSNVCVVALKGQDIYPNNNRDYALCAVKPTLQIACERSTSIPPCGIYTNDLYAVLTNAVTTPFTSGSTQYHCTGWTMPGNAPVSGSAASFTMTHTNDTVLTWVWGLTNIYFSRSAGANGSISGDTSGWYQIHSSATITANPDDHYHFAYWTGSVPGGQKTQNPLTLNLDQAHSAAAVFAIDTHSLSVATDHSSATPSAGSHNYNYGSSVAASVSSPQTLPAGTQYYCTGWSLSGLSPASGSTNSVSLTITNNATLHWQWGVTNVKLNAGTDGYGSLSGDTTGWYTRNGSITITANEGAFEHFAGWSGDVPSALTNNNPLTLTMDQTRTIQANFSVEQRNVIVTSPYGSPSPAIGTNILEANTTVNASVNSPIASGGTTQFVCTGWTMSGHAPASGSSRSFSMTLTNDAALTWHWGTNVYFRRAADGPGSISGNASGWYAQENSVTVTAVSNNQYTYFIGWQGTIPDGRTNDNPLTLTLSDAEAVTALFYRCESELQVVSPHGSPSPSIGFHTYNCGDNVNPSVASPVTAGTTQRVCTGWTMTGNVPVSGTTNSLSMTITNDCALEWLWGQTNYYYQHTSIGSGSVTGSPPGWYESGSIITALTVAAPGGHFIGWQLDVPIAQTNNTPLNLLLDQGRTIRAVFSDVYKNLSVSSAHGSPNPAVGAHSNLYDSTVNCSVGSPVYGVTNVRYLCTGWTMTGNAPLSGSGASFGYTVTNAAALTWNWKTNLLFSATADGNGTLSGDGTGWYDQGSSITITAQPAVGYAFCHWSGTINPALTNNNPLILTLDTPHSVTACFAVAQRTLTIASAYGTADPVPGTYTNLYGVTLTNRMLTTNITAASTQIVCTGWTMTGNSPVSGSALTMTMTQTNNATLTWNWATNVRLTCSTTGSGSLSGSTGTWQRLNSSATITANPDTGQAFAGWSGDVPSAQTNQNPLALTMDQPRDITAHFEPARYTLQIVSPHGTGTPPVGTYTNDYGTLLTNYMPATTIIPGGTQYVLTGWTLTGHSPASGTSNTMNFTVTNNAILTWHWTTNVQLSWTASGSGSVTGAEAQWFPLGGSITITAVPNELYEFDNWSGDVPAGITNDNPITLTMDQSRDITANFSLIMIVDFAVDGITVNSSPDRTTVNVSVSIQNLGTDAGDAGTLTIWANRPTPANCGEVGDASIAAGIINPGQIKSYTFTNLYPGAGSGLRSCRVFVDSNCQTAEEEERNNQYALNYSYLGPVLEEFTFSAFALTNDVYLRWTAPTNCGLPNNKVRIVYNNTHYPADAGDGTQLVEGYTNMYIHAGCAPTSTYYYTIWVNDGTYYVEPPDY